MIEFTKKGVEVFVNLIVYGAKIALLLPIAMLSLIIKKEFDFGEYFSWISFGD